MLVALAQIKPIVGDIETNIERHVTVISKAIDRKADLIIFPELSLTGYEPRLANKLAMALEDQRLSVFQNLSDNNKVVIGVGLPSTADKGINISLDLFLPQLGRKVYSKHYLHADEEPYFVSGNNISLSIDNYKIALAVCYELSVAEHIAKSFHGQPDVYITSVAKTKNGTAKALEQLSQTAKTYATISMMCNSIGLQDGEECWGSSAAWNEKGELIGQLGHDREGILFVDCAKGATNRFDF